jgi:biopolymer transport protein ExbB
MSLLHLFKEGGFIMYPLLIFSIIIWAVAIEKILFLKKIREQFHGLQKKCSELVMQSKWHEARGLCHHGHAHLIGPFMAILAEDVPDKEKWEHNIGRRLKETQAQNRRFIWLLGTIGSSAPFVGLFGTVVGIIKSFDSIAASGKSGFNVVAAGLSEALVATAAGIIVAVIAVIFYNYFQTSLNSLDLVLRNGLEDLMDLVEGKKHKEKNHGN